jgi:hypothetical protein
MRELARNPNRGTEARKQVLLSEHFYKDLKLCTDEVALSIKNWVAGIKPDLEKSPPTLHLSLQPTPLLFASQKRPIKNNISIEKTKRTSYESKLVVFLIESTQRRRITCSSSKDTITFLSTVFYLLQ